MFIITVYVTRAISDFTHLRLRTCACALAHTCTRVHLLGAKHEGKYTLPLSVAGKYKQSLKEKVQTAVLYYPPSPGEP